MVYHISPSLAILIIFPDDILVLFSANENRRVRLYIIPNNDFTDGEMLSCTSRLGTNKP